MGKVEIHGLVASSPARAVMIACEIAGIPYELKPLDPMNKTLEFKKLNPQQQIPVLVDDGLVLAESRAIMKYLIDKYAKDDSLYPKDLKTRSIIDARLDFDNGTMWPRLFAAYRPMFTGGKPSEEALQSVKDAVSVVEEFLTRDKWIAGPKMTIADISYCTIFSLMKEFKFDVTPYPKVTNWLKECDKIAAVQKFNNDGIANLRERLEKLGIKIK